ncbi:MAG: large extracellular alpha-helical protein [Deltaproteobacteria bacterium]|nr:large extracellular alpha-helical protein [Deltaproteobacteria bacterium]
MGSFLFSGKRFFFALSCLVLMGVMACDKQALENTPKQDGLSSLPERVIPVIRVNPKGEEVEQLQQIVLEFSSPVAPVGRMERNSGEIPLFFEPEINCEWRWLGTRSLACMLSEKDALQKASVYHLKVRSEPKEAESIESQIIRHGFKHFVDKQGPVVISTIRPSVNDTLFRTWSSPSRPVIEVTFNQYVLAKSVAEHLFFMLEEGNERVPLELLPIPVDENGEIQPENRDENTKLTVPTKSFYYRVTSTRDLGEDKRVQLMVEPGLLSAEGPETGSDNQRLVQFDTFPKFSFLGIRCCMEGTSLKPQDETENHYRGCARGKFRRITTNASPKELGRCDSQSVIEMLLSAPTLKDSFKKNMLIEPDPRGENTEFDFWADDYSYSQLWGPHERGTVYTVPLPYGLKAFQEYRLKAPQGSIKDEFGRALEDEIDFVFATAHRLPRFFMGDRFSVLESEESTHLPVAVQNLDSLSISYKTLTSSGVGAENRLKVPVDNVQNLSYYFPLKIRNYLGEKSGILYGNLFGSPDPARGNKPYNPFFVSQVTPFHVHTKLGHFNSLVWVTRLKDGEPVSDARVRIYAEQMNNFTDAPQAMAEAITDDSGVAILPGSAALDPEAKTSFYWGAEPKEPVFKVRVDKGEDFAILPLVDEMLLEPFSRNGGYISNERKAAHGHLKAWGTTPQGIYKLGQILQYKIYVREQDGKNLIPAPRTGYALKVFDPMGKVVHEVPDVEFSRFGGYSGEFMLPESGAVGSYRFQLILKFASYSRYSWRDEKVQIDGPNKSKIDVRAVVPLTVLVSDFTPASFRVQTDLAADLVRPGDKVRVITQANLHAGGAYTNGALRLTGRLIPKSFEVVDQQAAGFDFGKQAAGFDFDTARELNLPMVFQSELTLDDKGRSIFEVPLSEQKAYYGTLVVESAVRDDRGRYVAARDSAVFAGRDRYVGLNFPKWMYPLGEQSEVLAVVSDERGRLVSGVPVTVTIKQEVILASRVRGPGNVYEMYYETQYKDVSSCELSSGPQPVGCKFTPTTPGSYLAEAVVKDTLNREHSSKIYTWVSGQGEVLWNTGAADSRIDIVPEKTSYKVGETARFLLKNPFPGAQALISIERYGVISHWRQTLPDAGQVIEVPVTPELLPSFYLSVVLMSGRVESSAPDMEVDLGKPTMRMGYAKIDVRDKHDELDIQVKTEREEYKPSDTVKVALTATTKQGETPTELEYAVAVLDESVFDLISAGRNYFDPYAGFFKLMPLDLFNFNLLLKLVGKRKFEKKGANSGGDGLGAMGRRTLFKYVAYWNPTLVAAEDGTATFEFEAPDNLTGWRVLALALTPGQKMGLGEGSFKVNKLTEIRPAIPNQVHAGDVLDAQFVLMNRADKARKIEVNLSAKGDGVKSEPRTVKLTAKPFERHPVSLPVSVSESGQVVFTVSAKDEVDSDLVDFSLNVLPSWSLQTAATYGSFDAESAEEKLLVPGDIRSNVGSLEVTLSPSILSALQGAFAYMRDYPYSCWEQILSKGVMAFHYNQLKAYVSPSFVWEKSSEIPQNTLDKAQSFQAPNGGMSYFIANDQYVDPYLSAYTALAFVWLKEAGYNVPVQVEARLQAYLEEFLRKNTVPDFYSERISATVRAVALHALASAGKVSLADLQRFEPTIKSMSIFGRSHYALAALKVKGSEKIQRKVLPSILAGGNETSGKFMLLEDLDTSLFERILSTPLRDNCAALSAIIAYNSLYKNKKDELGIRYNPDIAPKLAATISQTRGGRDHWENTQENLFCMKSLSDYSREYESKPPQGKWKVSLSGEDLGETEFASVRDEPRSFQRGIRSEDLGQSRDVQILRQGQGRTYYNVMLNYAPLSLPKVSTNAGIEVIKEVSVQRGGKFDLLSAPYKVKVGDLLRVDIYLSLPEARNFVVVNDPLPGGLEALNREFATASSVDAAADLPLEGSSYWYKFSDWIIYSSSRWSFYHRELRHDSVRFYSEYLPSGNYHLAYLAQVISPGEFLSLPLRAEEIYSPDTFGQTSAETMIVQGLK